MGKRVVLGVVVLRVVLGVVVLLVGGYGLDAAVWLLRGLPTSSMPVSVMTVMEFKNGKEDYGQPEVRMVHCVRRALPGVDGTAPCWWVGRHTQVMERP